MAITFLKERKKQTYLMFALPIIILIIISILLFNYFLNKEFIPATEIVKPPKVKINWETLKAEKVKELISFDEIEGLAEEIGRENPFSTYK